MKVDVKGDPVGDGTFGLYNNMSARVVRTCINPIEDSPDVQKVIAEGGYMLDLGKHGGVIVANPDEFYATHNGDTVFALDGQKVEVGDTVICNETGDTPYTIKSVYPIGALEGETCCSLEELKGGAPDDYYAISWGGVVKVTKKAGTNGAVTSKIVPWPVALVPTTPIKKGDWLQFKDDNNNVAEGIVSQTGESGGYDGTVTLTKSKSVEIGTRYLYHSKNILAVGRVVDGPWETKAGIVRLGDTVKVKDGGSFKDLVIERGELIITEDKANLAFFGLVGERSDAAYAVKVTEIVERNTEHLQESDWMVFRGDDDETIGSGPIIDLDDEDFYVTLDNDITVEVHTYSEDNPYWVSKERIEFHLKEGEMPSAGMQALINKITASVGNGSNVTETNDNEAEGDTDMATATKKTTGASTDLKLGSVESAQRKSVGKIDVIQEGTQIVLPKTMALRTAISELQRRAEQEEMDVNIMELIEGFPLDAAHAFIRALEHIFGWVNAMPTPGFFGPTPPTMVGLTIDPDGHTVQIPWGTIGIPGVTGKLQTGIQMQDGWPTFCIQGTIKQKDKKIVNEIATFARNFLKDSSIYKGKAIKMRFPTQGKPFSPLDHQPKFIETANVKPEELVFSRDVERRIRVNIWTPITAMAAVEAARVPLKRGVLLYGRYGTGKTLLARVTAHYAVKNGVTFIDLEDSKQLPQAIKFARTLSGMVVVFAEDIDLCNQDRETGFNDILNTVDGLTSKSDKIMVVYTTNHVEKISKALLRQGRIDKVIQVKQPDAEAACRLMRLYARHMLDQHENIEEVGAMIAEQEMIPAAIREIVEQSKLAAIERGDVHKITAADLRLTVEDTKEHNELCKEAPVDDRSELERLGQALGREVGKSLGAALEDWDGEDRDVLVNDVERDVNILAERKVA